MSEPVIFIKNNPPSPPPHKFKLEELASNFNVDQIEIESEAYLDRDTGKIVVLLKVWKEKDVVLEAVSGTCLCGDPFHHPAETIKQYSKLGIKFTVDPNELKTVPEGSEYPEAKIIFPVV